MDHFLVKGERPGKPHDFCQRARCELLVMKEKKWKWRDMWPSIVLPTLWISALHLSHPKCTHTHTHTVNTHPEQWAAIYAAAPGEQLGVQCLAQGHLSRGIEGEESAVHSLPPTTIPAGPRLELTTFGLGHDFIGSCLLFYRV